MKVGTKSKKSWLHRFLTHTGFLTLKGIYRAQQKVRKVLQHHQTTFQEGRNEKQKILVASIFHVYTSLLKRLKKFQWTETPPISPYYYYRKFTTAYNTTKKKRQQMVITLSGRNKRENNLSSVTTTLRVEIIKQTGN